MKIKAQFSTDNAAFVDGFGAQLRSIILQIEKAAWNKSVAEYKGETKNILYDLNGNTVGEVWVSK